jgi:two-component system response regulator WspF
MQAGHSTYARSPCAILVVTVDVGANPGRVYEAMGAGALDAIDTQYLDAGAPHTMAAALLAKIDQFGDVIGDRVLPVHVPPSGALLWFGRAPPVAIGASAGRHFSPASSTTESLALTLPPPRCRRPSRL